MRVTIVDYGAGNLHSLAKALRQAGGDVRVESDPATALETDVLVLPGVGAFPRAAAHLAPAREAFRDAIAAGLPLIGVCLGMQLLLDASDEGEGQGLGLIPGVVTRLHAPRVPQIGWNDIEPGDALRADPAPRGVDPALARSGLRTAYYANGFACRPTDGRAVTAWSTHGDDRFPAMVRQGRAVGVQFHPEKSSAPGVALLRALLQECAA